MMLLKDKNDIPIKRGSKKNNGKAINSIRESGIKGLLELK
jgi:hypothetical protein